MTLETMNYILSLGTILMMIAAAALLVTHYLRSSIPFARELIKPIERHGLWIGFALTLVASVFTLYYSDILGLSPCDLCWWQRICLFPQVVLFAIALWKRDASVALYSIALSIIGLGFAAYHHLLQVLPSGTLPCPAQGVSCAQRFVFEFGFVTLPLMAVAVFALIGVLMFVYSRSNAR